MAAMTPTTPHRCPTDDPTYRSGLACLQQVEATDSPAILGALANLAPDLAHLAVHFAYGQVCARPGLSLPTRQLLTVAMLAALGNARPQLKFHLAGALNVGCSSHELVELMLHLAVYAGFPAALNAVQAAQTVLAERTPAG